MKVLSFLCLISLVTLSCSQYSTGVKKENKRAPASYKIGRLPFDK